jgi:hypothetical protein
MAVAGTNTNQFLDLMQKMVASHGKKEDATFNASFVYTLSVIQDGIIFGNERVGPLVGNSDQALESVSQALWAYLSALRVNMLSSI